MSVALPVTANFPNYDRDQSLPRIVTSVGVSYPFGCKVSVSFTYKVQIITTGMLSCSHYSD